MKKISIGICCYNEELNIEPMYHAVLEQAEKCHGYEFEIIFEDNASTDGSHEVLKGIAESDPRVKVCIHQANYGIERSSYNCMKNASGDAFISIPCDFEEPPELIPDMIREWESGNQIVLGQKTSSKEKRIIYFLRETYYKIVDLFSDYPQIHQITGFGLYDRKVVDVLLSIKQADPYIYTRQLLAEYGFSIKLLPYQHGNRRAGRSSFTLMGYLSVAINSLCNTSTKPLRIITLIGVFGVGISGIGLLVTALCALFLDLGIGEVVALVIWIMLLVASVQIFSVGMLGEYVTVLLRKATKKPIVLEKEKINFDDRETDADHASKALSARV